MHVSQTTADVQRTALLVYSQVKAMWVQKCQHINVQVRHTLQRSIDRCHLKPCVFGLVESIFVMVVVVPRSAVFLNPQRGRFPARNEVVTLLTIMKKNKLPGWSLLSILQGALLSIASCAMKQNTCRCCGTGSYGLLPTGYNGGAEGDGS